VTIGRVVPPGGALAAVPTPSWNLGVLHWLVNPVIEGSEVVVELTLLATWSAWVACPRTV